MRGSAFKLGGLVLTVSLLLSGGVCFGQVDPSMACGDINGDDALCPKHRSGLGIDRWDDSSFYIGDKIFGGWWN